ncbi:MAG TPA: mechanosensitive ion channel family protein [Candidatus Limnocylindrales bacterium]|jgi:small conductance mechanosensitive channel|nr:mechanosensitive ion channel family protein [Candidatus Limnocylindrales bacterium]
MTLPSDLSDRILDWLRDPGVPILLIVVIALIVIRLASLFVRGLVKALLDREATEGTAQELSAVEIRKRMDTLETLGTNVIRLFVFLIALVMILGELGLDIGPAVAGLGVVGIAVGFGTQSIVRDYFTGALILIENQYSKGDVVTIAGVSGTVEDFSLRRTTLRDLDGVVHTVPNGEVHVASNRTRVWARINQDVTVAYGTDIEKATQVVNDVGKAMAADPAWRRRVMEAPHVERIEALGEYGITLKVLGLVRATEQWAAGGELRKRLLAAFATHGIEIPRPQRVVLAREPNVDPFSPGGATLEGPTQDDLSLDTD